MAWILNDPPPKFGAELAECQRSQFMIKTSIGPGISNGLYVYIPVILPIAMRKKPTAVYDSLQLYSGSPGEHLPITGLIVVDFHGNTLYLRVSADGLLVNQSYVLEVTGYLLLDSNM